MKQRLANSVLNTSRLRASTSLIAGLIGRLMIVLPACALAEGLATPTQAPTFDVSTLVAEEQVGSGDELSAMDEGDLVSAIAELYGDSALIVRAPPEPGSFQAISCIIVPAGVYEIPNAGAVPASLIPSADRVPTPRFFHGPGQVSPSGRGPGGPSRYQPFASNSPQLGGLLADEQTFSEMSSPVPEVQTGSVQVVDCGAVVRARRKADARYALRYNATAPQRARSPSFVPVNTIPEPSSLVLVGVAFAGIGLIRLQTRASRAAAKRSA